MLAGSFQSHSPVADGSSFKRTLYEDTNLDILEGFWKNVSLFPVML